MSDEYLIEQDETGFDRVLSFSVPDRDVRGRAVRLGPVLDHVLSAHDYPQPIRHVMAEALVLTTLMGSLLKDEASQLTFQIQAEGGTVDFLVCDFRDGDVRGYLRYDSEKMHEQGSNASVASTFGTGYLAITFDLATSGERYQGIVPLEGDTLSGVCERYFERSEQIPTLIRVAVRSEGGNCVAGGMLVQHFPDGEEGKERLHVKSEGAIAPDWEHIVALAGSVRYAELVDPALSIESLIWRLLHEEREIRVGATHTIRRGCRCTVEHYQSVLTQFPETERADMRDPDGRIPVECEFCSKVFRIDA
ncbi:Hsp33 family molecular chaperone HslO [Novosphingobium aquimarinum]|uniref:Hsp33 family molecular chaperone HslO n=1 Tax=Novosphingobium aquimarinum TaxID=2682494 RepID=UPI0018DAFAF0|nr:Hsp33 family molecular chaperone HslO [Novosphingobium aquimarinum]